MGWFSWLTGSSDTANKVVDSAVSGLDVMFFTDEEKSQASQKVLDWKLKYLKATAPQNVARRAIAIMVVALWMFLILLGVGMEMLGAHGISKFIFDTLTENVNTPFGIIIGFYFAAHVVRGFKGG